MNKQFRNDMKGILEFVIWTAIFFIFWTLASGSVDYFNLFLAMAFAMLTYMMKRIIEKLPERWGGKR